MTHMPVFLLNLESATHRLADMTRQLAGLGIEFERFPAVIGKSLSDDERAAVAPRHRWEGKRLPSPGEIGCFLSHRAMLREIADRNAAVACILEDDVKISSDFPEILAASTRLPAGADAVKLEIAKPRPRIPYLPISAFAGRNLVFVPAWGWPGTAAYIVTAAGARKLLAALDIMIQMYDYQAFNYARNDLLTYHLFPLPVEQVGDSEIGRPPKQPRLRRSLPVIVQDKAKKRLRALTDRADEIRFQVQRFGLRTALSGRRICKLEDLVRT